MCGIVGVLGNHEVAPLLVEALKRLEYRGYDSAGIATVHKGQLDRRRAVGKLVIDVECSEKGLLISSQVEDTRMHSRLGMSDKRRVGRTTVFRLEATRYYDLVAYSSVVHLIFRLVFQASEPTRNRQVSTRFRITAISCYFKSTSSVCE